MGAPRGEPGTCGRSRRRVSQACALTTASDAAQNVATDCTSCCGSTAAGLVRQARSDPGSKVESGPWRSRGGVAAAYWPPCELPRLSPSPWQRYEHAAPSETAGVPVVARSFGWSGAGRSRRSRIETRARLIVLGTARRCPRPPLRLAISTPSACSLGHTQGRLGGLAGWPPAKHACSSRPSLPSLGSERVTLL